MFSSEDETFFFSMKIEDPDSPHSSESERRKIKWLVIWTSVRSLVLVTVFTSEVIRKKSSPKYFCQVVPLHHQPHMCNLLSDKVTYMAVCGMWTAGHLKWIARHNQNRKRECPFKQCVNKKLLGPTTFHGQCSELTCVHILFVDKCPDMRVGTCRPPDVYGVMVARPVSTDAAMWRREGEQTLDGRPSHPVWWLPPPVGRVHCTPLLRII